MKLLFILGNHPDLSLAELRTVLESEPLVREREYAVFETNQSPLALQERLAGTIKVAEILGETTFISDWELAQDLQQFIPEQDGKVIFGVSAYGEAVKPMRIGLELKKFLRARGVKVRLVTSSNKQLSAADLLKNKVLEHGFEFLLFQKGKQVLVARTIAFQPLETWTSYDMERPVRDMKRGMLPPKLARLMVNLSGTNTSSTLLDPFCGTGTILEQAGLIGVTNLIGSDIDPAAINATRENFAHFKLPMNPILRVSAAKNIHALVELHSVTHIVTEPFLGKRRSGREPRHELTKQIEELELLYAESFAGIKRVLAPGATIVVSLPRHYLGELALPDRFIESIERVGYKKEFESLYRHKDQSIGRNIVRFRI